MTVEKSDDLLSDDIFRNWEEPTTAENMELQKIKNKGNTRNIFDAIGTKNNAVEIFVFPKLLPPEFAICNCVIDNGPYFKRQSQTNTLPSKL